MPSVTPDGKLIYPKRGKPPVPPQNYKAEPGNPYVLVPIWPECKYRQTEKFCKSCGEVISFLACTKKLPHTLEGCLKCPHRST